MEDDKVTPIRPTEPPKPVEFTRAEAQLIGEVFIQTNLPGRVAHIVASILRKCPGVQVPENQ